MKGLSMRKMDSINEYTTFLEKSQQLHEIWMLQSFHGYLKTSNNKTLYILSYNLKSKEDINKYPWI